MTEKSGNRNLGRRDSQEHKTVDGGKKRRFVVSRARKTRRGEKYQRCHHQRSADRTSWDEYVKEFSEQSCNGCCVNPKAAIVHLVEEPLTSSAGLRPSLSSSEVVTRFHRVLVY